MVSLCGPEFDSPHFHKVRPRREGINFKLNKMRSNHFCLLSALVCEMLLLAATSCEKMTLSESPDSEQPNVVLRVSRFEQIPFPSTRAVDDICTRISFLVYDMYGDRIRQQNQQLGDEDFGETNFFLPSGHYFLVVVAHSSLGNPTSTNARRISFTNKTGYTDTFLYADSLVVNGEDIEKGLTLKRIVSMVRFQFDDEVPARSDSIRFYYTGGSGVFDAVGDGWGVVNSKQSQFYGVTHQERHFDIYTIPHAGDNDKLMVTVTSYHSGANSVDIISEREIDNIPVRRNKITLCRGSLFSPVYVADFDITILDRWDNDTIDFEF